MILIIYNLLIALTFTMLTDFTPQHFILGYIIGLAILALVPQLPAPKSMLVYIPSGRRLLRYSWSLVWFVWDFIKDLTISNIQIAWDVLTPKDYYRPILVEVPVADLSDFEIMIIANRITLTPGTLSLDLTADRSALLVHVMYPGEGNVAAQLRRPIDILRGKAKS